MKTCITFMFLSIVAAAIGVSVNSIKLTNQQCQIDQLNSAVFSLAHEQGAGEAFCFTGGKEYCLFFADYSRNAAIVGEFDGEISYDKKPRLIIMRNINEKTLEYWDKAPIVYGWYKKIR